MATVYLPQNLLALFPRAPRQLDVEGASVRAVIEELNTRFPGIRSRLVDAGPVLREHINIFVDSEKADLSTSVRPQSQVRVIPAITGG
jgi:sulfur-carrier protein